MQNCKYNKSLIKKNDFFKWYICDRCGLINNKIIKDQKYFQSTKNKLFNNKNSTNKFELENFYSNNIEKLSLKRNIIWFDYGCGNGDSLLFLKKLVLKIFMDTNRINKEETIVLIRALMLFPS